MSQLVVTTKQTGVRHIGARADRSVFRIQRLLEKEFDGNSCFVLAEPVVHHSGTGIDWYVETDDHVIPLAKLHPDVANYHRHRLQLDIERIRKAADAYEARNDEAGRSFANTLRVATTFPGNHSIWIAGDSSSPTAPIIVTEWGYEAHAEERGVSQISTHSAFPNIDTIASRQDLITEIQDTSSSVRGARHRLWPLLLLPLLALGLAIGFLLIPDCGLRMPWGSVVHGWQGGTDCVVKKTVIAAKTVVPPPPVAQSAPEDPAKKAAQSALKKTGIVQKANETAVTLIWHNRNDLDIQAHCPDDTTVAINKPYCGAYVDYDDNGSGSGTHRLVDDPVEHLTWGKSKMIKGRYTLIVEHFPNEASTADKVTEFTVIFQQGTTYKQVKGWSRPFTKVEVLNFDVN
jgi:hypothetical protein